MTISEEDKLFLDRASAYEILAKSTGWRQMLDYLATESDKSLAILRSGITDPNLVLVATIRWRTIEEFILKLQNEVLGTVEQRNKFVRDVLKNEAGLNDERIDEVLSTTSTTGGF